MRESQPSRAREDLVFFGSMRFVQQLAARSGMLLSSRIIERATITANSSQRRSKHAREPVLAASDRGR